jgi:fimbrial chaperone protein
LSVLPVNIFFSPGQRASSLTVTNQGTSETAIQIRAYAWNQKDGDDQLTASDAVVLSPPIARMAPGALQVIRLILRQPPRAKRRPTAF